MINEIAALYASEQEAYMLGARGNLRKCTKSGMGKENDMYCTQM